MDKQGPAPKVGRPRKKVPRARVAVHVTVRKDLYEFVCIHPAVPGFSDLLERSIEDERERAQGKKAVRLIRRAALPAAYLDD